MNLFSAAIRSGVPLVVVSPHLDDAVLSCGSLLLYAVQYTRVTVATLFTEGEPPPYTLSARRYLHQVGARDAESLYARRRAEDRAALEPIGSSWVHGGVPDALYRRRPAPGIRAQCARLLPELVHTYPLYRVHIVSGHIAPADAGTLATARQLIGRLADETGALLLAPLGLGGNVDHVLARTAAERSGRPAIYYSDFPYDQHGTDSAFARRYGLVARQWPQVTPAKADLIRAYGSQVHALFPDGQIPLVPETYFFSPSPGHGRRAPRDPYDATDRRNT